MALAVSGGANAQVSLAASSTKDVGVSYIAERSLQAGSATARTAATAANVPLYEHLAKEAPVLPAPMMNALNGGRHADIRTWEVTGTPSSA